MKVAIGVCMLLMMSATTHAQTQDEAKQFLIGAFAMGNPMITTLTCDEITMLTQGGLIGFRFNPRSVSIKEYMGSSVEGPSVVFSCITGACIWHTEYDKTKLVGKADPYTNGLDPQRVVRAFEFYQKSCGGPAKSSF